MERDLSGPDSAALDRAKVRTMSKTSHADSYPWRRPRARRTAAIAAKCPEMSASCRPRALRRARHPLARSSRAAPARNARLADARALRHAFLAFDFSVTHVARPNSTVGSRLSRSCTASWPRSEPADQLPLW